MISVVMISFSCGEIKWESSHDTAYSVIFAYALLLYAGNYQQGEEAMNLSMKLDDLKIDMDDDEDEESGNTKVITWHDITWNEMKWNYDIIWHGMTWYDITWHESTLVYPSYSQNLSFIILFLSSTYMQAPIILLLYFH